jgi:hypothetical protein
MLYLIAFAVAAAIALLLWRAMSADRADVPRGTGTPGPAAPPRRTRPTGPDDDPDFLRSLDESVHRDEDPPPGKD